MLLLLQQLLRLLLALIPARAQGTRRAQLQQALRLSRARRRPSTSKTQTLSPDQPSNPGIILGLLVRDSLHNDKVILSFCPHCSAANCRSIACTMW